MQRTLACLVTLVGLLAGCSDDSSTGEESGASMAGGTTSTTLAAEPETVQTPEPDCDGADTQLDLNLCLEASFDAHEAERLAVFTERVADAYQPPTLEGDPDVKQLWTVAEQEFVDYREATCDAVYFEAADGSGRSGFSLECKIGLTREHIQLVLDRGYPGGVA